MDEAIQSQALGKAAEREETKQVVESDFHRVVTRLCKENGHAPVSLQRTTNERLLPSRKAIIQMVETLRSVLFPGYFGIDMPSDNIQFHVGTTLDHALQILQEQLNRTIGLLHNKGRRQRVKRERLVNDITRAFLGRLCEVKRLLATDVQAAFAGDPAATSPAETILCYPGICAVTNYRLAHELHSLGVPLISRIMTEHAHSITGIDIHPGAKIGESFFIDHGTGVVIGETTVIGKKVRIYQGVTLGAINFREGPDRMLAKGLPRHPIIEDDVVIYSGATILGRITIGRGSVIGGNVWLTHSIPPGSKITQARTRVESFENGGGI